MRGKIARLIRRNYQRWDVVPREVEPITEREEARNAMRDWLRDRDEDDLPVWDEGEREIF